MALTKNEAQRRWRKRNPEQSRAIGRKNQQKYAAANPEKIKAHQAVVRAVRRWSLVRSSVCEHCGDEQFCEASHTDYNQPLDVEWLCRPCHMEKDGLV